MQFDIRYACDDIINARELFAEYAKLLVEAESRIVYYLDLQGYDSEAENLDEKYGLPDGRFYIAYLEGKAAACIALRKMNDAECELKRLYVKAEFRGQGIATALLELVIADARDIGYRFMLLDTLPALKEALKLYEKKGFYRIGPYNDNPVEDSVFLRLDL